MKTEDALIKLFTTFKWPAPTGVWVDNEYGSVLYFTLGPYNLAWNLSPMEIEHRVYLRSRSIA